MGEVPLHRKEGVSSAVVSLRLTNMAHTRQPRPDYGLGFQVKVLETVQGVASSRGSDYGVPTALIIWLYHD